MSNVHGYLSGTNISPSEPMQVDQQNRVIVFQSLNTVFVNEKIPLFVWLCISCTGIYLFGK